MVKSIASNLIGYDSLIILLALLNGIYILPNLKNISEQLKRELQGNIYLPIKIILKAANSKNKQTMNLHELEGLREKETFYYHMYGTITMIFPLMGILGTVIGLLRMVGSNMDSIINNFTIALTSTFWGLLFAIIFRTIDGFVAPIYYQNQENLQMIFERIDLALNSGDDN